MDKSSLQRFKNSFLGNSSIYVLSNIIEGGLIFALLPVLTTHISKSDYGILAIYLVFVKSLIPLVFFGTNVKLSVDYFKNGVTSVKDNIGNLFLIPVINAIILISCILVFHNFLQDFLEISLIILLTVPVFIILQFFPTIYLVITQCEKNPISHTSFKISNTILNFLLALLFILVFNSGWFGQIAGYSIGFFIFSVLSFYYLYKNGFSHFNFNFNEIIQSYKYGAPLLFYSISGIAMSMGDRVVLKDLTNYENVGIYTVAYQVSTVISLVAIGFTKALAPKNFEDLKIGSLSSIQRIKKSIYFLMGGLVFISILLTFSKEIIFNLLISSDYIDAQLYLPIIIVGLTFQGFYMFQANILFYFNKNSYLGLLALGCAVLNIVLNYIFIPSFGIFGACYSTAITYLILWSISWLLSWRQLNLIEKK